MTSRLLHGRGVRNCLVWLMLLLIPLPALAAQNLWRSSVGQTQFVENRAAAGDLIAGTAWENALQPGNVYRISFSVKQLRGTIGVLVGDLPVIPIDARGNYAFSFIVTDTGERRMLFQALSDDVAAHVTNVSVTHQWHADARRQAVALPRGHYWSFDQARDLHAEMVVPLQTPSSATAYFRKLAANLHDALTTPGVRGIWMAVDWNAVEVGDGRYDWRLIDRNIGVARAYGLKLIVQIADRSFSEQNVLPGYFPPEYVVPYSGGTFTGLVAKRWDPYVYQRLIRLYAALAARYRFEPAFGGVATSETSVGEFEGHGYDLDAYVNALIQIATQSQVALNGRAFLYYQNFLSGGNRLDLRRDYRVNLLRDIPHSSLLVGAPDITPDVRGVVRAVSPYRVYARKHLPGAGQFCHLQHVDLGHRGVNTKNNVHRLEYLAQVKSLAPGSYETDDVGLHPESELGKLWQPQELLDFGRRNFACAHVLWHYRDGSWWQGAVWQDVQQVILQNQDL